MDSTVLAALAARAVGAENVILLMAVSPILALRERRFAWQQAKQLGITLREIETHEYEKEIFYSNPPDRCYFCRIEMFQEFDHSIWKEIGIDILAYGENADDSKRIDRPGARAAAEYQVRRPLSIAGASKADVRALAAAFGLLSTRKPSAPCLATRIPHGEKITVEKLRQIDKAEDVLLDAGFSDCRVRHHGDIARIELPDTEISRLLVPELREELTAKIKATGFRFVTVDLSGLQSGLFTLSASSTRRNKND